jgi:hypothetical protein
VFINYVLPPSHCSHWGLLIGLFQTSDWLRYPMVYTVYTWFWPTLIMCVAQPPGLCVQPIQSAHPHATNYRGPLWATHTECTSTCNQLQRASVGKPIQSAHPHATNTEALCGQPIRKASVGNQYRVHIHMQPIPKWLCGQPIQKASVGNQYRVHIHMQPITEGLCGQPIQSAHPHATTTKVPLWATHAACTSTCNQYQSASVSNLYRRPLWATQTECTSTCTQIYIPFPFSPPHKVHTNTPTGANLITPPPLTTHTSTLQQSLPGRRLPQGI